MRRTFLHIGCLLMLLFCNSCEDESPRLAEKNKWPVSLAKEDKQPYGSYLAYNSLKYFFPDATVEPLSKGYRFTNINSSMMENPDGVNLMVLSGLNLYVSEQEWEQLQAFVKDGNELVIFCSGLDEKIGNHFNLSKEEPGYEEFYDKDLDNEANKHMLHLSSDPSKGYGYLGRSLNGYFNEIVPSTDTSKKDTDQINEEYYPAADTLGFAGKKVDFIRFSIGEGHITFHAAPLVMSNYFLLQPGNINYMAGVWSTLPRNIARIYWLDYYKHSPEESSLSVLMRYKSTRWAILLSFFGVFVYVIFKMKRRQRIVPIIPPLKNDSVSFIETVGRLYFNKGNNANLADKMIQQYLEWVRMHYYLNTNVLNAEFSVQLAHKSGLPQNTVYELMHMIHEIRTNSVNPDDAYLYQLYRTTQLFYKNHHK